MPWRDTENCRIKHLSMFIPAHNRFLYLTLKIKRIIVLFGVFFKLGYSYLSLLIFFLVMDQYSNCLMLKARGCVSVHWSFPLANIKRLKFLFKTIHIVIILSSDDAFTCPVQRSPSAVPGRGQTWPGSACCWEEWRTEWFPPQHWALLCWWPGDTGIGETIIYPCHFNTSAARTPAVPSRIHSTTFLSPVTHVWNT